MKLVIVGGHLSPALAVIDALPKDTQVLFIGRKHVFEGDTALSLEYREINKRKIRFVSIYTGRLQRRFTRFTISSLFKIPYGFIQSFFILRNFKPEVVLSFGGYLSLPVNFSAFFLRIPIVIHEQTLGVGFSNKILSFFAKKVCISWESSRRFFPQQKTVMTGNPIRDFQLSLRGSRLAGDEAISKRWGLLRHVPYGTWLRYARNDISTIYITGGSGGSHFINILVEGCLQELLENFFIIHQTGDAQEFRDFDRLNMIKESLSTKLKTRYMIVKFVQPDDIGSILMKADLVVGRSGINTITELIFFKKPSLVIPLPYSQNNEQVKNALFLKDKGLGEIFYQNTSNVAKGKNGSTEFLKAVIEMFDNMDKYRAKYKLDNLIKKNAAQEIVDTVFYEASNRKK